MTRTRAIPTSLIAVGAGLAVASSGGGAALTSTAAGHGNRTGTVALTRGADASGTGFRVPKLAQNLEALAYPLSQMIATPDEPVVRAAPAPPATPSPPAPTPDRSPSGTPAPRATAPPTPSSGPAPFGAVLIPGCTWAPMIPLCDARLTVYSNGGDSSARYQCSQLVSRWMRWAWNEVPASGPAYQLWDAGPGLPVPLAQHPNGGADAPQFGDVLVFAPGQWTPSGHISVVTGTHTDGTGTSFVDTVEQNAAPSGRVSFPLSGTTVSPVGRTSLLGWLRPAVPTPLPRPLDPITISASWTGGGGSWSGSPANFEGPGGARITGRWSGYMCMQVRRWDPDGSFRAGSSCDWDVLTLTLAEPPIAGGSYSVTVQPGKEPPI